MLRKSIFSLIFGILGVLLISSALYLFIAGRVNEQNYAKIRKSLLDFLREVTPEVVDAVPDGRGITDMPCVQLDGYDLIGSISVPAYDRELPVGLSWESDALSAFPRRYCGSVYDGTLVVGGSQGKGNFDFVKTVSIGDAVYFTDVDGDRFSFSVSDIRLTDDVSADLFDSIDADLVLFAGGLYSFDYTVVICKYN